MSRSYRPRDYFQLPDGTRLSAFLNATDTTRTDIPWNLPGDVSIASGLIEPKVESWVHLHPVVTQTTYVVSGEVRVRVKTATDERPRQVEVGAGQAVVAQPGTLFQITNPGDSPASVLYIASPSYVFELDSDGNLAYDDAVLIAQTWDELERAGYDIPAVNMTPYEAQARRLESTRRIARMRGHGPRPLAEEKTEHLAHHLIPAGTASSATQNRTVEALWYVIEGNGQIWRARDAEEVVDGLAEGDSIRIPAATSFQFRAAKEADLKLLMSSAPPWPGAEEALPVTGKWP